MEGRYGGRASEKAGNRDTMALDTGNDVPGGLEDNLYAPSPEEDGWQGQGGTGGRWGARRSDKAAGRDAEMAYGEELGADVSAHTQAVLNRIAYLKKKGKPADLEAAKKLEDMLKEKDAKGQDSFPAQMQELDDKLKSGMISKQQYDALCAKLEDPEAVIDYKKSGYERSGRSEGGMSEDDLTPVERQKFEALKKRRAEGQLSESEKAEFVTLRDKVGRVGFKSAGATRDEFSPEARKAAAEARKAKATTTPKREKPHPATRNYGERRAGGPSAGGNFTSSRGRPVY